MKNTILNLYNKLKNEINKDCKVYMYDAAGVRLHWDSELVYLVYNKDNNEVLQYININGSLYYISQICSHIYVDINNITESKISTVFDPGNNIKDNISNDIIDRFNYRSNDKIVAVFNIVTKDLLYINTNERLFRLDTKDPLDELLDDILPQILCVPGGYISEKELYCIIRNSKDMTL